MRYIGLILLTLVLMGAGVVGYFFLLSPKSSDDLFVVNKSLLAKLLEVKDPFQIHFSLDEAGKYTVVKRDEEKLLFGCGYSREREVLIQIFIHPFYAELRSEDRQTVARTERELSRLLLRCLAPLSEDPDNFMVRMDREYLTENGSLIPLLEFRR